jgi:hypothetical protein
MFNLEVNMGYTYRSCALHWFYMKRSSKKKILAPIWEVLDEIPVVFIPQDDTLKIRTRSCTNFLESFTLRLLPSFPSALQFDLLNNLHPFFIFPPHPFTFILWRSSCTSSNHSSFADVDFRSIHSSEADYLVSEQFSFYGVRLLVSRPTPNQWDQGIPLRLAPNPWPGRHGWLYK